MLRHGHRLRYGHAQFAPGLLLERRGGERRCGVALGGFLFGLRHREGRADAAFQKLLGLRRGFETRSEFGLEERLFGVAGGVELRHDAEIGGRAESDDLALALDDQPHGHRLHAPCRERRTHLFPQHGRELETDQPVEDAARLLGVYQVHIDRARFLDGFQNRPFGDLVEDDALGPVYGEPQHFGEVPCDGFSFAVFIGRQPDGFRFGQLGQFVHHLLLVARDFVDRFESLRDIDAEVLFRKVPDMAEARFDDEVLAEEFLDGLGLGGGLDDN